MATAANKTQTRAIAQGVDLDNIPIHVALIMDGNGRWATRQGKERLTGHWEGYRALRDILSAAGDLGIDYLTVYGFSAENWRRPTDEVDGLMDLIADAARQELEALIANNVRVRLAGRIEDLDAEVRFALKALEASTAESTGTTLVLAINYGGRAEIVDAVRRLVAEGVSGDDLDEDALRQRLYLPDVPDPDIIVRTAGESRTSNFLLWQGAYAELVVTEVPWPEFGVEALVGVIAEYQSRHRKFGAL